MNTRRRYDDNFRASAVVALQAAGYPETKGALAQIAKKLDVPVNTLKGWFTGKNNPPSAELRTEKKGELVEWITTELKAIFGTMNNVRDSASYKDLATAAGILIDKKQLLSGEPTSSEKQRIIIEYADFTDSPS